MQLDAKKVGYGNLSMNFSRLEKNKDLRITNGRRRRIFFGCDHTIVNDD
jgi:hypothetical protein